MSAVIVGISIGNLTRRGVGVAIIDGGTGEVLDATTVTATSPLNAGPEAMRQGDLLSRRFADAPHVRGPRTVVVFAVEEPPGRPTSQQARAASRRRSAEDAATARRCAHAVALERCPDNRPLLSIPHQGEVAAAACPAALSGKPPASFRGERGVRREVQRNAWAAAEQGRLLLHPGPVDAYPPVLARLIRGTEIVGGYTLADAAEQALAAAARPVGAPALTPDHVARWMGATEEHAS